jgi:hypothetical protein
MLLVAVGERTSACAAAPEGPRGHDALSTLTSEAPVPIIMATLHYLRNRTSGFVVVVQSWKRDGGRRAIAWTTRALAQDSFLVRGLLTVPDAQTLQVLQHGPRRSRTDSALRTFV